MCVCNALKRTPYCKDCPDSEAKRDWFAPKKTYDLTTADAMLEWLIGRQDREFADYIVGAIRLRQALEASGCPRCGAEPWVNIDCAFCDLCDKAINKTE